MKKIRIGLAGLGTVGKGVYEIIQKDAKLLTLRSGASFEVVAASARSKKDFLDPKVRFYSNALDLVNDAEIDVIVEVIGGTNLAKELLFASIKNGKKFVTANKALLANHGAEIAEFVEKHNGYIGFEASTAGANPVIKAFKESFTSGQITEFYAILNGTCNFILTKMGEEKSDFAATLKEAQNLGYAEADPTLDIKGFDAAHKLTILSSIASSSKPDFSQVHIEGIDHIDADDVELAANLGYKIKLLAVYKNLGETCQQTLYPALIKKSEKIANVDGPFNAVLSNTSNASWNMMIGRGAGGLTTGSAIVADLIDIACERYSPLFGVEFAKLSNPKILPILERCGGYFICLKLDKSLAKNKEEIAKIFDQKIGVKQASFKEGENEIIGGFLTEEMKESDLLKVLQNLDSNLVKSRKFLRVEQTNF